MNVLIADRVAAAALQRLESAGVEVTYVPDTSAAELSQLVAGFQVLVVRSTKVGRDVIEAGKDLSLIIRAGAGVNTIDVESASRRGVYVSNCPGRNSAAVAELAIGLLVACDRRIADASAELRLGRWNKKAYSRARGLYGRTLGILGMGTIGQAVARRAQGMGMHVSAWSRSLTAQRAEQLGVSNVDSPESLAAQCDALSVHLAAAAETRHLVNASLLAQLPEGAIVVNTSRGDIIDTDALKDAIRARHLRVGLDVFENEPAGGAAEFSDTELAELVTATPHIGASTEQAASAIADEAVRIIVEFRATGRPPHAVNTCQRSPATHSLVVRHYNQVGVLAGILDALRAEGINIEEMDNAIFNGAQAACCTLQLDQPPSPQLVRDVAAHEHVLNVHVEGK